jgi:hypothetical protein
MHPYSTNTPIHPRLLAALAILCVTLSGVVAYLISLLNKFAGLGLGGVSAMTLFGGFYWLFDKHLWKHQRLARHLLVPNLNGSWSVAGKRITLDGSPEPLEWTATIRIEQSWSRIVVVQSRGQSGSASIAASLYHSPGMGYRLIYHYDNTPKGDEDLGRHFGLCDLCFDEDLQRAEGTYFTDRDRQTTGTMILARQGVLNGKA